MNFDAGRVRSMTGPSAVKVRTPVAISAQRGLVRMGQARCLPWWIARGGAANPAKHDRVDSCRGGGCATQDERSSDQHC